ncbi:MAG: methyltransferase domain-containing protein [Spirochaetia bacterium]
MAYESLVSLPPLLRLRLRIVLYQAALSVAAAGLFVLFAGTGSRAVFSVLVAAAVSMYPAVIGAVHAEGNTAGDTGRLLPRPGLANLITLFRGVIGAVILGVAVLGIESEAAAWAVAALYGVSLLGDLADGYTARRLGTSSALGRVLENEVDSLGCLAAVLALITEGKLPWFFLILGAARYIFVLFAGLRRMFGFPVHELRHSRSGRFLAGGCMTSLLIGLIPPVPPEAVLILVTVIGVPFLTGFIRDYYQVCTGRSVFSLAGAINPKYSKLRAGRHAPPAALSREAREDVRRFFDGLAAGYHPIHGDPGSLFARHMGLLYRYGRFDPGQTVLDVGCGLGDHLFRLKDRIGYGIGTDISPEMIERARELLKEEGASKKIEFRLDEAARLETVADRSIDRIISVGALSHISDSMGHFLQAQRVLKPGGRYICLASNGDSLWHRVFGPVLGLETRHLSSDRLMTAPRAREELVRAGFGVDTVTFWRFVPSGDMPRPVTAVMKIADLLGRLGLRRFLWGGLLLAADKPPEDEQSNSSAKRSVYTDPLSQ